jgi:hypothetical protein
VWGGETRGQAALGFVRSRRAAAIEKRPSQTRARMANDTRLGLEGRSKTQTEPEFLSSSHPEVPGLEGPTKITGDPPVSGANSR